MNYASTARRPNPVAAMGALGVPTAVGTLLIFGLAFTVVIEEPDQPFEGFTVKVDPVEDPPPAPPSPTTDPVTQTSAPTPDTPYTPPPLPRGPVNINLGESGPLTLPPVGSGDFGEIGTGPIGLPSPMPTFDPVLAQPRGDTGRWITDSDYRTSWINRGFEGLAGFRLEIDARGRVSDCAITRSTGHSVLDDATCRLLERRARFDPARDSSGNAVAGSFASSVDWTIPE